VSSLVSLLTHYRQEGHLWGLLSIPTEVHQGCVPEEHQLNSNFLSQTLPKGLII